MNVNEDKTGRNKDVNIRNNIVNHIIHLHLSDLNVFLTFISYFFIIFTLFDHFFWQKSLRDNDAQNQKARQLFM